jgi:hypothetical protein
VTLLSQCHSAATQISFCHCINAVSPSHPVVSIKAWEHPVNQWSDCCRFVTLSPNCTQLSPCCYLFLYLSPYPYFVILTPWCHTHNQLSPRHPAVTKYLWCQWITSVPPGILVSPCQSVVNLSPSCNMPPS